MTQKKRLPSMFRAPQRRWGGGFSAKPISKRTNYRRFGRSVDASVTP